MLAILYIIIGYWSLVVESTHFYAGTVTWKPMNNTPGGSTVAVMFTQSYQWRRSYSGAGCTQSTILNQSPLIPGGNDKLSCTTSSCGGYTAISINEYCTDFSALVDSSSGQISTVQNIAVGSSFCVAYDGSAWTKLYATNCGSSGRKRRARRKSSQSTTTPAGCYSTSAGWSVGTCIDLTIRSDGFINTPPVATIISPIKVPVNSLTDIKIPVIDADNDYLRCRWAEKTTELDECGDVCQSVPGSTLDEENCTLTFNSTGKNVGDYFAVTLMVEDFYNSTSDTALSRVPIQFLIYIANQINCTAKPTISSTLPECSPIQVGTPFNFSLTIIQGCPGTTVTDVFTMPPQNVYKVNFTQNGTDNVWILSQTWTPTTLQLGSQIYCAVATDSVNVQSDQYCTTFTVVPAGSNSLCPGETSTTLTTTTSSSSTTSTASTSSTTRSTSTSSSSSTSTSSTTKTTTTTTSTESTTSTTTSVTTTTTSTTSTSTSTSSTSSTTSTTSTSTSTSSTSSTTTTTSTSTSTSSTTTTTSTSTSTSSTSSTTSTTSTSTSTITTSSATTSTSTTTTTTSITTTTTTSITTTTVTTATTYVESTTAKTTNQINLPLVIGLSLLGLLALLALCCCWRLFKASHRRRRKQNEEQVISKYTPFNENFSRKANLSSSNHHKSTKINRVSAIDLDDHISQRSRTITINSLEYHTDQNLNLNTIIDETKSRRGKSSNDVNIIRTNQVNKSFPIKDNISIRTSLSKTDDVSKIGSISSTPSVRVIKAPKDRSSSRQNRNESLSALSKNTTTTSTHNQSNELKPNHSTNITVTKIKRLNLPSQTSNELNNDIEKPASSSSSNIRHIEAPKSSYSIRRKLDELSPKPNSSKSMDVRTTTKDIIVTKLRRADIPSDINHNLNATPNQSSVIITTLKNRSSVKCQSDRSQTNASDANVIVTKVARTKSLT